MIQKNKFIEDKLSYIDLLEKYYTYLYYYHTINNILTDNVVNINYRSLQTMNLNDNIVSVISYKDYNIDHSIINDNIDLNKNDIDEYNSLIKYMNTRDVSLNGANDIELYEKIKAYLETKSTNDNNKSIEKETKMQDNYIDYIITKLPIISNDSIFF